MWHTSAKQPDRLKKNFFSLSPFSLIYTFFFFLSIKNHVDDDFPRMSFFYFFSFLLCTYFFSFYLSNFFLFFFSLFGFWSFNLVFAALKKRERIIKKLKLLWNGMKFKKILMTSEWEKRTQVNDEEIETWIMCFEGNMCG